MRIASQLPQHVVAGIKPTGKHGRYTKGDFAGQPGFDYETSRANLQPSSSSSVTSAGQSASGTTTKMAKADKVPVGQPKNIYDIITHPGPVVKSVSDTHVLTRLLKNMQKRTAVSVKPRSTTK
uniref:Tubby-related protein 3 n=1 Tax=Lygus hesperus TaxID=30085 RepID=A0A0A9WY55_LYGHE